MINGNLEQFLDTGWYSEAALYYAGYIYWCEADTDFKTGVSTFWVDKERAENEDNLSYRIIVEPDGTVHWERVFECTGRDLDFIKKKFLEAKIFDGKSFWEVENEIAWLDEGEPIRKK